METVRKMHVVINGRATRAGEGIISQKDMSLTLFAFMGFHLLMSDKFGIVGSRKQFEAFNHFWRVIGYMLGVHDKFNCCAESLDETLSRLESMRADILLPGLEFPCPEYESYTKIALDGMWHFDPFDNYFNSVMFILKRALEVPGYYYFESEAIGDVQLHNKMFQNFTIYTRFRILLDIVIYEYLSHIFIFRWVLNLVRISLAILDFYPVLALKKFGKKYAYVEIMKSKTK